MSRMSMSRRRWMSMAACAIGGGILPSRSLARQRESPTDPTARISRVIVEYGQQGFHRTGTDVDRRSGDWLFEEVRRLGLTPAREPFELDRIDPEPCHLVIGDRRIEGLPLFDGAFTDDAGIRGLLGPIGSDAEIGLVEAPPNTAAAGALGEARRHHRHRALVCVTRGGRPGLCPNNADFFLSRTAHRCCRSRASSRRF